MQFSMEKLTGALVLFTAMGVYVGFDALMEYKRANMEAVNARIAQIDRDVYTMSVNNDKFDSLFAYFPEATTAEEVRENSRKLLSLSVDERIRDAIPEIKSIEDLYNLLYNASEYDVKKYKSELRNAFTHADLLFYVVNEAHSALVSGLLDEPSYRTWAAYVLDVGTNPLFLLSVYIANRYGYVDRAFAYEIRKILLSNDRTRIVVETLYPDMFNNKKWADNVGEMYIKKHKPTKHTE